MTSQEFTDRIAALLPVLYRICASQFREGCDREDAVQEALRRAWEKAGTLREEAYFDTWVIRILLNVCHSMQKRRRRFLPEEAMPERAAPDRAGDRALYDALLMLDEKLRTPILLHYIEGYRVEEVARMLGTRPGTVKTRMKRGREKLKELLSGEEIRW